MTNPSAEPIPSLPAEPSLAQLIPMYQAMQAALAHPPSPQLIAVVKDTLERTTDPLMIGFLNLLITGDTAHRDLAAQIFRQLEVKIVEARQKQTRAAAEQAGALVEASPLVTTLVKTLDSPTVGNDAIDPIYMPSHDELMAAWARQSADQRQGERYSAEADDTAHYEDRGEPAVLEEPAANVVTLQSRREPILAPYETPEGEHYTLRYTGPDGKVTKEEKYSILTVNTQFPAPPETILHQIRGVIIGIGGQSTIEHGFGYVLPLEGMELMPSDKSLHIPLRLEYPTAMPIYDDHNAANVAGLKEFMALHEALRKGYTVCMDLYVKVNAHPSRGNSLSLTMQREKLVLRRQVTEQGYGSDGAMFSSLDLEDLHLALKKLELVGIFATHETR